MSKSPKQSLAEAGREEVMAGALGFNIKFLSSIWTLFVRPEKYFKAARSPDWLNKYTPSVHLLLASLGLMMAIDFLWAKSDGNYIDIFVSSFDNAVPGKKLADSSEFRALIAEFVNLTNIVSHPVYFFLLFLFAWAFRAWGKSLTFTERIRYMFALVVPSSIIGFFLILIGMPLSPKTYYYFGLLITIIPMLVFFVTAIRGPFFEMDKGEAIGRTIFLLASVVILNTVSVLISFAFASFYYANELVPFLTK